MLSVRLAESEKTLRSLRAYANSAGFRFTEGVIARLRSVPIVFTTSRAVVRKIVNRKDTPREGTVGGPVPRSSESPTHCQP